MSLDDASRIDIYQMSIGVRLNIKVDSWAVELLVEHRNIDAPCVVLSQALYHPSSCRGFNAPLYFILLIERPHVEHRVVTEVGSGIVDHVEPFNCPKRLWKHQKKSSFSRAACGAENMA